MPPVSLNSTVCFGKKNNAALPAAVIFYLQKPLSVLCGSTCADRDRKHTEDYETCVRQTDIARIEIYVVYIFRQSMLSVDKTNCICTRFFRGTPGVRSLQEGMKRHDT